jgi:hypothetical protein
VAFVYLGAWMLIALAMLAWAARTPTELGPAGRTPPVWGQWSWSGGVWTAS